jgi:hypothetical protein
MTRCLADRDVAPAPADRDVKDQTSPSGRASTGIRTVSPQATPYDHPLQRAITPVLELPVQIWNWTVPPSVKLK